MTDYFKSVNPKILFWDTISTPPQLEYSKRAPIYRAVLVMIIRSFEMIRKKDAFDA